MRHRLAALQAGAVPLSLDAEMPHDQVDAVRFRQGPPSSFLGGDIFEILPEVLPDALSHLDDDLEGLIHVGLHSSGVWQAAECSRRLRSVVQRDHLRWTTTSLTLSFRSEKVSPSIFA